MRSAAQKEQQIRLKDSRYAANVRKGRRPQPEPVERETVEQWAARTGKSVTQCEPITGDPAAAIQRARGQRAELKFPRSPKNCRREP